MKLRPLSRAGISSARWNYSGYRVFPGGVSMTFTEEVKNELVRLEEPDDCCRKVALAAIIRHSGNLQLARAGGLGLNISTQSPSVARAILKLVKEQQPSTRVFIRKRSAFRRNNVYLIFAPDAEKVLSAVGLWDPVRKSVRFEDEPVAKLCCKRAYLRGAFLVSGTINDPKGSSYHLEIVAEYESQAEYLCSIMKDLELRPKTVLRKGLYVAYLKEIEQIIDFVNMIGAHSALLRIEDARVVKDMRNKVNRLVNAETANLNKTVAASWRQLEAIRFLDRAVGILSLPQDLQQVAEFRGKYPDASLQELGQLLDPPISTGTVNHRLRK